MKEKTLAFLFHFIYFISFSNRSIDRSIDLEMCGRSERCAAVRVGSVRFVDDAWALCLLSI